MGLSSSKKTTTATSTTKPVYDSQITGAYTDLNNAFDANESNVSGIQGTLSNLMGTAAANYSNNPTLNASKNWVTSTLGSDYSQNPYLDSIISQTNSDVANKTATSLGTRGLSGGSVAAKIISNQLAQNEGNLRYGDYNNWQNRQQAAAGMAPGLASADATNMSSLLGLSNSAASLSTDEATKRAAAIAGLLGGYTTTNGTETTKSSGSILDSIAKIASAVAAVGSDMRLKTDIRRVGMTDGGLPIYTYRYKGEQVPQMGVMAQDVAQIQPEALGPVVHGYATVKYGEVR